MFSFLETVFQACCISSWLIVVLVVFAVVWILEDDSYLQDDETPEADLSFREEKEPAPPKANRIKK